MRAGVWGRCRYPALLYDIKTSVSSNQRFLALHTEDREIGKPLGELADWMTTAVAASVVTNLDQMARNKIMRVTLVTLLCSIEKLI